MDQIDTLPSGLIVADVGLPTSFVIDPETLTVTGGTDGVDEGYPDIIVTQLNGYATSTMFTVQDVEAFWEIQVARRLDRPIVLASEMVTPYINSSRWVADCLCGAGMLCWDQNPNTCCLGCGTAYFVSWQPPVLRSAVIRVLAGRPEANRHWDPRRKDADGNMVETVEFLVRENLLMGIV